MCDGVLGRAAAIWSHTQGHVQSLAESFIALRVLVAPAASPVGWQRILVAVFLVLLALPEREAAIVAEMLTVRGGRPGRRVRQGAGGGRGGEPGTCVSVFSKVMSRRRASELK